jgi:hypothetical protein
MVQNEHSGTWRTEIQYKDDTALKILVISILYYNGPQRIILKILIEWNEV